MWAGTGHHLKYVRDAFTCIGVDLSAEMLDVVRRNVRDIEGIQADMIDMELGQLFDVITCLFSSIGYVKTYANLKKTLQVLCTSPLWRWSRHY